MEVSGVTTNPIEWLILFLIVGRVLWKVVRRGCWSASWADDRRQPVDGRPPRPVG
jgi:hypothetical protein